MNPKYRGEEKRRNGDIYTRLENLESNHLEIKKVLTEDCVSHEKRTRDNEENIRSLSKDIVVIKDSQVSTHKRITQVASVLKEDMRIGFSDVDKSLEDLKKILLAYIESASIKISRFEKFQNNVIGAIKLVLGIPAVAALIAMLMGLVKLLSENASNLKNQ